MKCGVEVAVTVPTVADSLRICRHASDAGVNFTLENAGSATIDQLQVKFFTASGFGSNDTVLASGTTLASGSTTTFSVLKPTAASGDIVEVKIIPRVKVVGRSEYAYCTDASLTFSDMNLC
jgi:hypothetical protein